MTEQALVAYIHRRCGRLVHVEVSRNRDRWQLVCACGKHLRPDGFELMAVPAERIDD